MPPKQKALEKAAANAAERDRKAAEDEERRLEAEWSVGAKSSKKEKASEEADALRRQKAAEKAALEAAEEAELSGVKKTTKTKKKGKDDFDLLNAALASAPKTKAQKELEAKEAQKKAAAAERKLREDQAREAKESRLKSEEDYVRKMAAKGIVVNHTDDLFVPIQNRLEEDDFETATGMDDAIDLLVMGKAKIDTISVNRKALYKAFEERNLPEMREEMPGLKLSQYKERIFEMWKSAPENPDNSLSPRTPKKE